MHLKALRSKATPPAGRHRCSPMGCVVCDSTAACGRAVVLLLWGTGGMPPGWPGACLGQLPFSLSVVDQRKMTDRLVLDEDQPAADQRKARGSMIIRSWASACAGIRPRALPPECLSATKRAKPKAKPGPSGPGAAQGGGAAARGVGSETYPRSVLPAGSLSSKPQPWRWVSRS